MSSLSYKPIKGTPMINIMSNFKLLVFFRQLNDLMSLKQSI